MGARRRFRFTLDGQSVDIDDANDLSAILDVLNGQRDRIVLEQLGPRLKDIVRTAEGLMVLMRSLATGDQIYLLRALSGALAQILREARSLRELLALAAEPDVKRAVIDALGEDGLRALIASPHDLAGVLEWTYGPVGGRILELVGPEYLRRHIRHGDDLALLLRHLTPGVQDELIACLGFARVVELTRTARDLALLLHAAPPEFAKTLIRHFTRQQLIEIIGDRKSWRYLYARVRPDEAAELLRRLGVGNAL